MKKVVICLISLFVILLALFTFKYLKKEKEIFNISFLSSNTVSVDIYNKEFKEEFKKVRGTKVKSSIKEYENNNIVYKKIILDNNEYYVNKENLVSEKEKIIQEKELYIRTSTIIYKEPNKQFITSSIKKGEKVDIIGYDTLNEDGTVLYYKIKYNDLVGYIYSKYLVSSLDEALKNYDE